MSNPKSLGGTSSSAIPREKVVAKQEERDLGRKEASLGSAPGLGYGKDKGPDRDKLDPARERERDREREKKQVSLSTPRSAVSGSGSTVHPGGPSQGLGAGVGTSRYGPSRAGLGPNPGSGGIGLKPNTAQAGSGSASKETSSGSASTSNAQTQAQSHRIPYQTLYEGSFPYARPSPISSPAPGKTGSGPNPGQTSSAGPAGGSSTVNTGNNNNVGGGNKATNNPTSGTAGSSSTPYGSSYGSPFGSFFGGGSARRTGGFAGPLGEREREREREREQREREREPDDRAGKREWEEKRRRELGGASASGSGPGSGAGVRVGSERAGQGQETGQKTDELAGGPGTRFRTPSALLPSPRSVASTPGQGQVKPSTGATRGGDTATAGGQGGSSSSSSGNMGFNPLTSRTLPSPFERPGSQPGTPGIKVEGPSTPGSVSSTAAKTGGMKLSSLLGPGGSVQSDKSQTGGTSSVSPRPAGAAPASTVGSGAASSTSAQPGRNAYGFIPPHTSGFAYDRAVERQVERLRMRESDPWERTDRDRERDRAERSGSTSAVLGASGQRSGSSAVPAGAASGPAAGHASSSAFGSDPARNRDRGLSFGSGAGSKAPGAGRSGSSQAGYDYPASALKTDPLVDRLPLGSSSSHSAAAVPLSSSMSAAERERERERPRRELLEREKERDREQERARIERERRDQYEREAVKDNAKLAFYLRNPNPPKLPSLYPSRESRAGPPSGSGYGNNAPGADRRRSPSNDPAGPVSYQEAMRERDRKDPIGTAARRQMEMERTNFYDRSGMFRSRPAADVAREVDPDTGRSTSKQAIEVLNRPLSPIASSAMAQSHPAAFPPAVAVLPQPGYPDIAGQTTKSAPVSPPRNAPASARHAKRDYEAQDASKQAILLGANGLPVASNSKSHKRKRSQAYAQDPRDVDLDRMDVDADSKLAVKKRSSKQSGITRDVDATSPRAVPIASQLANGTHGLLSVPPAMTLDVRSESVEVYLRNLGMKALLHFLGKAIYKGWDWMLDAQLLSDNIGGTMEILIPGRYLPSPPDHSRGWAVRGEKEWDEGVSEAGRRVMSRIPGFSERRLWGSDVYTDDSDILAVMIHSSWLRPIPAAFDPYGETPAPINRTRRAQDDLKVLIRVAPKLIRYVASERAGFVSRGWGNSHDGVSYVIETVSRVEVSHSHFHRSSLTVLLIVPRTVSSLQPRAPFTKSRRNAKLRMAANLLQRQLVFGHLCSGNDEATSRASEFEPLPTDIEMDDGIEGMSRESDIIFLQTGHVG